MAAVFSQIFADFQQKLTGPVKVLRFYDQIDITHRAVFRMRIAVGGSGTLQHGAGNALIPEKTAQVLLLLHESVPMGDAPEGMLAVKGCMGRICLGKTVHRKILDGVVSQTACQSVSADADRG